MAQKDKVARSADPEPGWPGFGGFNWAQAWQQHAQKWVPPQVQQAIAPFVPAGGGGGEEASTDGNEGH